MKWLRQTTATAHGRMKIGSAELVLDEVSGKYPDPSFVVIAQQFRALRRLLQKWPASQVDRLKEAAENHDPFRTLAYCCGTSGGGRSVCQGLGVAGPVPGRVANSGGALSIA